MFTTAQNNSGSIQKILGESLTKLQTKLCFGNNSDAGLSVYISLTLTLYGEPNHILYEIKKIHRALSVSSTSIENFVISHTSTLNPAQDDSNSNKSLHFNLGQASTGHVRECENIQLRQTPQCG